MTGSRDPIPFPANKVDRTNTQQLLQRESEDGTLLIAPAPFLPSRSWSPVTDFSLQIPDCCMRIIREVFEFNGISKRSVEVFPMSASKQESSALNIWTRWCFQWEIVPSLTEFLMYIHYLFKTLYIKVSPQFTSGWGKLTFSTQDA